MESELSYIGEINLLLVTYINILSDTIKQNLLLIDRVCLSGITVAILPEEDRLKLIVLLNELSANGVQIAFDTNFRPALWPQEAERMTVKSDYQPICLCVILHWLPLMMSKLCG
jgi:sugar/nucleoside kinase (ribokinase family)